MESENVEAILNSLTPNSVTNFRSTMALAGYYRRFIDGFSTIAHPITLLQRKNPKFISSKKCEGNFDQLVKLLTGASILNIANPKKDFVVCTNAFIETLGGVLI